MSQLFNKTPILKYLPIVYLNLNLTGCPIFYLAVLDEEKYN